MDIENIPEQFKKEAYDMMTRNGAKALGVGDELGTLEEGKTADIILLDIDKVEYQPSRNLMHTIMMTASSADVTDVIIGGNILMNNRAFTSLDEERILYEGKMQMKKMLSRI